MKTLTFNNPDPATGSPGTLVTTDWFQNVNDEIILVITEAGITPVSTDHTQLNQALQKVYAPLNSPNLTGTPTTTTPPDGDDSQKICNTAWVNSVITAGKLGYTPVRQGGVSDQGSDTVYIGNATDGSGLKATVNTDDLGNFAFESWVKGNYLNLTGGNITGTLTLKGTSIATVNTVNDAETDIKNWTEENYLQLTDTTTQTVTGPVAFTGNMSNSGAAGTNRQIVFETSGLARFAVGIDGDAESGANEGSNLYISRFDDEGSFIDDPLGINRETGTVEVNSSITVPDAASSQNPVTLGQLQAKKFIANALIGVTSITSSLTFTRNAATKWLHIRACGGGGGGGGAPWTDGNNQASAGGGFSGQYIELWITAADFGASVDIVIGAGGTAPSNGNGDPGGTTTIGSLVTLLGGGGGFGGSWGSVGEILPQYSTDTPPVPAKGIVVLSRPTTAGRSPMITFSKSNGKSGDGGDTPLGTGGPGTDLAGAGIDGTGYGSGGGGASVGYNQSVGQAGGLGMPGVVIIEEYT